MLPSIQFDKQISNMAHRASQPRNSKPLPGSWDWRAAITFQDPWLMSARYDPSITNDHNAVPQNDLPILCNFRDKSTLIYIYVSPCHSSHRGGPCSNTGEVMWDLWWIKWHWGQVFSEYFVFPCQFSFHRLPHTHYDLPSRAGTMRQIVDSVSPLTQRNKKKTTYTNIARGLCSCVA
jgi:hypothetical protein